VIAMSISASTLAHGVHYAVLGVGLVGVLTLLAPQLAGPRSAQDEHARRVRLLGEQIDAGALGTTPVVFPAVLAPRTPPVAAARRRTSLHLSVAIVSSAAAAGVHAAVGPAHFSEKLVFGLFFAGSAMAQVLWSVAVVARPTRLLLELGVIGNVVAIVLWAQTRTVGLGSLLPHAEAVGPWDLCCVAWEIATVVCCSLLLAERRPAAIELRLAAWADWAPSARAWAVGSAVVLGALTLTGAGA
jgi:hypothetical protein